MFDNVTQEMYTKIFGSKAEMMREFYRTHNSKIENDWKSHYDDFEEYLREHAYIGLQGVYELLADVHTGAKQYERTTKRLDYRNGYERQNFKLPKIGEIAILRPTMRHFPKRFTNMLPSREFPKALGDFVLDILLSATSIETTKRLLQSSFGVNISRTTIANYLDKFQAQYNAWRDRAIPNDIPYLFLDGTWVDVSVGGQTRPMVFLTLLGMREDRRLIPLAFKLCESENYDDAFAFLQNVKARGITEVRLVTADQGAGFEQAIKATWNDAEYQPCSVHKLRNLIANTADKRRVTYLLAEASAILRSRQPKRRNEMVADFMAKWEKREPKAVRNFVKDIDAYFRFLSVSTDEKVRRRLHSTNPIERYFREVKRKTKQIGYFRSRMRACLWFYLIMRNVSTANADVYDWSTAFLQD